MRMLLAAFALCAVVGLAPRTMPTVIRVTHRSRRRRWSPRPERARATALICNIGDSRICRYTTAGELHQSTLDDSSFGSDWDIQLRLSEVVVPTGLIECTYFEQRHVMDRALGEQLATPHLWEVRVWDGDVLLAVSDGVTDNLTFSELRRLLHGDRDGPDQIADRLVDAAYSPQPPDWDAQLRGIAIRSASPRS